MIRPKAMVASPPKMASATSRPIENTNPTFKPPRQSVFVAPIKGRSNGAVYVRHGPQPMTKPAMSNLMELESIRYFYRLSRTYKNKVLSKGLLKLLSGEIT